MKAKINRALVESAAPSSRPTVIWDSEVIGFGLVVYPNGARSFVFDYRIGSRRRRKTIGTFPITTAEMARKTAKQYAGMVAVRVDPFFDQDLQKQALNVKEFSAEYLSRHANKLESFRNIKAYLKNHILPVIGARKIIEVRRSDVSSLHSRIASNASEVVANRCLALLSKMFNMAEIWGRLPEGHPNPCRGVSKFKEQSRDRWVSQDEMKRLFAAISASPNMVVRAAIMLFLFTGMRRSELLSLKWDDIDDNRGEIRLAKTKQGRKHYIPLTAPAIELLRSMPALRGNPYVFPGRNKGRPLVNISKPWLRIRKSAKIEDVRLHDLRRTVGSWLAQQGASLHLIGAVLGHSNASTTQVYARFQKDTVRNALEEHSKRLIEIVGKQDDHPSRNAIRGKDRSQDG